MNVLKLLPLMVLIWSGSVVARPEVNQPLLELGVYCFAFQSSHPSTLLLSVYAGDHRHLLVHGRFISFSGTPSYPLYGSAILDDDELTISLSQSLIPQGLSAVETLYFDLSHDREYLVGTRQRITHAELELDYVPPDKRPAPTYTISTVFGITMPDVWEGVEQIPCADDEESDSTLQAEN